MFRRLETHTLFFFFFVFLRFCLSLTFVIILYTADTSYILLFMGDGCHFIGGLALVSKLSTLVWKFIVFIELLQNQPPILYSLLRIFTDRSQCTTLWFCFNGILYTNEAQRRNKQSIILYYISLRNSPS